jgi:hypothetical protein
MGSKMSKSAIKTDFPEFAKQVKKRLQAGAEAYGDISFSRSPEELVDEITQEVLDIAGWGWILYHRLQIVKKGLQDAKDKINPQA